MFYSERHEQIMRILEQRSSASVHYIATKLFVSEPTVRRDLAALEREGRLRRTYGGAALLYGSGKEIPLSLRENERVKEKKLLAELAKEYIRDGMTLFIDASSTCLHMVPYLAQHTEITVYTNSLEACSSLSATGIPTYCLGGQLLPKSLAFTGAQAIRMAQSLYFDALFFSCSGYDTEAITDYSESEAELRRVLLQQSKKAYFLCDNSKFGSRYTYVICRPTDVTKIITD